MTRGSVLLAAALPALLLLPHVLVAGVPYFCDPVTQAQPYHVAYARELRRGVLPLFNPYSMGGASFAGNVQVSILYPPRLLAALLSRERALALLLAMHLALASGATALLAQRRGMSPPASLVAALCFGLGTFMVGKLALPPVLLTGSLLPLLLLAVDEVLDGRGSVARVGIASGLLLGSGHPQTAVAAALYVGLYALARSTPAVLQTADTPRARALRGAALLLGLLYVSGTFALASFGQPLLHPSRPALWLLALGATTLVVWRRGELRVVPREPPSSGRIARLLGGGLLGALLASGVLLPVLENLGDARPPRSPDRLERWAAVDDRFELALDAVAGHRRDAEASLFVGPVPILLAFGALMGRGGAGHRGAHVAAALALYVAACGPPLVRMVFGATPVLDLFPVLTRYLLGPALALALLAGLGADALLARAPRRRGIAAGALVTACALPLLLGARHFLESRSHAELYPDLPAPASRLSGELERYLTVDRDPVLLGLDYRRADLSALLMPNLGMVYEREDLQGYDPVHGWPIARLVAASSRAGAAFPARDSYHFAVVAPGATSLLRLLGVGHALVHHDRGALPGFEPLAEDPAGAIQRLPHALPRAFVPREVEVEPDARRAVQRVAELPDPAARAFVETPAALPRAQPSDGARLAVERPSCGRLRVEGALSGLVVVGELYARAWRARSGGEALPVVLVDGLVTGVLCERETRRIDLAYLPWGFRLGLFLSLVGVVGVASRVAGPWSSR